MEIRYRVFDNRTLEYITHKYEWVITPDGKLCTVEYDYLEDCTSCCHFELLVKQDGNWKVLK